jgi:hypothetical protein
MTDFILDELQEIHRAMTVAWSVKPDWDSYVGDATLEEHGEWPQTWIADVDPPPWYPHWGDILAPGFPGISRIADEEIAYELHTSILRVPSGDLTAIFNVPLEYEHIWTIRLYIRELEDNDLDGTEDHEEGTMTPEGTVPPEDVEESDDEYEIGLTDGSSDEEEYELTIDVARQLFPEELVVPQQVKDNCREGLRILEEIMDREVPVMKENDYVELCNIFKDVFQMRGSQEVIT